MSSFKALFVAVLFLVSLTASQQTIITGCDGWTFNWNYPVNQAGQLIEGALVSGTVTPPNGVAYNDYLAFLGPLNLVIPGSSNQAIQRLGLTTSVPVSLTNGFTNWLPNRFQRAIYYVACDINDPFKVNVTTAVDRCLSKQPICLWVYNFTVFNYPPKIVNGLTGYTDASSGASVNLGASLPDVVIESTLPNRLMTVYVFDPATQSVGANTTFLYDLGTSGQQKNVITQKRIHNAPCSPPSASQVVNSPTGVRGTIYTISCPISYSRTARLEETEVFTITASDGSGALDTHQYILVQNSLYGFPPGLLYNPTQLRTPAFVGDVVSNREGLSVQVYFGDQTTPEPCATRHIQGAVYKVRCPPHTYRTVGTYAVTINSTNYYTTSSITLTALIDPIRGIKPVAVLTNIKILNNDAVHRGNVGSFAIYPKGDFAASTTTITLITINWGDGNIASLSNLLVANGGFVFTHTYSAVTTFQSYLVTAVYTLQNNLQTYSSRIDFIVRVHPLIQIRSVAVPRRISLSDLLKTESFYFYYAGSASKTPNTAVAVFGPRAVTCAITPNQVANRYTVSCPALPAAKIGHTPYIVYVVFTDPSPVSPTNILYDSFQRNVIVTGPRICGQIVVPDQIVEGQQFTLTFSPDASVTKSVGNYNLTVNWGDGQTQTLNAAQSGLYHTTHSYGGFFDAQTISVNLNFPNSQYAGTLYNSTTATPGFFPFFSGNNGFYTSDFYYLANEQDQALNLYYLGFKGLYYNQNTYYKNYFRGTVASNATLCSMPTTVKRVRIVNSPPTIEPLSVIVSAVFNNGTDFVPPVVTIYDQGVDDTHTLTMTTQIGAKINTYFCTPQIQDPGQTFVNFICPTITLVNVGPNSVSFNVTDNNGAKDATTGYLTVQ